MKAFAFALTASLAFNPSAVGASALVNCTAVDCAIAARFQVSSTSSRRFEGQLSIAAGAGLVQLPNFILSNFKFTQSDFYLSLDDPDTNSELQTELSGTRRESNVYRAQLRRFDNGALIAPVQNLTCSVTPQ